MKITESKDKDKKTVTSSANAQRDLEKTVVRFRWLDGYVVAVEADSSANVDHVNFIKGALSALQVYSPVPVDGDTIVSCCWILEQIEWIRILVIFSYVKKMFSVFVQHVTHFPTKVEHKL